MPMDTVNKRGVVLVALVMAAASALIYIDHLQGPISIETVGVVKGSKPITDENGHAWNLISVQLDDGAIVEAKAPPECVLLPGQKAQLMGLRDVYSFGRSYVYLGEKRKDET